MTSTPKALQQQRDRRLAFVRAGKTVYGTERKNYQWPELAGLTGLERMNERLRICTQQKRTLLKDIDAAAAAIAEVFPLVPEPVQTKQLKLSGTLARLRSRKVK